MIPRGTKLVEKEVIHNPETGVTTIIAYHKGERMEILVDTVDWPLVEPYTWHVGKAKNTYYARSFTGGWGIKRKRTRMHAILFPDAKQVHHNDHNGLNNCRSNLVVVTNQQNCFSRLKQDGKSSPYLRVSWDKERGCWQGGIKYNSKRIPLGRYESAEEAARVTDAKALELFGEIALLNFPRDHYKKNDDGTFSYIVTTEEILTQNC